MASFFGHAAIALSSHVATRSRRSWRRALLAVAAATIPDLDALGHWAGIPYDSPWGHRGFTHSVMFAVILGALFARILERKPKLAEIAFFSLVTLSHSFFDALTNGGRGVALLWPFQNDRFFFPWRPIEVSPISIRLFFSKYGWEVIQSEALWIGLPCLMVLASRQLFKKTVN
jgi:inner membrane protein